MRGPFLTINRGGEDMEKIRISQHGEIIAHHTNESCLSHYGEPVWTIENTEPEPGPAIWQQGENRQVIDILEVRGGWLICRQPDGLLCGVIWSDGSYYAALLEDQDGRPVTELIAGAHVRGTVFDVGDLEDMGAVLL
jgi:hypothetical protein